jgi:hypothetical protein
MGCSFGVLSKYKTRCLTVVLVMDWGVVMMENGQSSTAFNILLVLSRRHQAMCSYLQMRGTAIVN